MKSLLVLTLCLAVVSAITIEAEFQSWMKQYGKTYSAAEYPIRYANYKATLERIKQQSKASPNTVFAPNQFSDLSVEEFRFLYLMNRTSKPAQRMAISCLANGVTAEQAGYKADAKAVPASWDWRSKNKVTPVENQEQCGSCWAFSVAGCLESAYAIKSGTNANTVLSKQQIVDCSHACIMEEGQVVCNQGCSGGWMWSAMTDVMFWGGLELQKDYPYTAQDGSCTMHTPYYAQMTNYTCLSVPDGADETTLMPTFLVNSGPLSIALNADLMMSYVKGIIKGGADCETTQLDHAVLIVGYGTEAEGSDAGVNYWIVKNSWDTTWGEKGFFRIQKGTGACGLNNAVVSPILS